MGEGERFSMENSQRRGGRCRRLVLVVALALPALCALVWPAFGTAAASKTITVAASSPSTSNCFPLGTVSGDGGWGPYFAFVYQSIAPFQLKPGDTLAFDLGAVNDFDIQVDIALAGATVNGGDVNAGPFTTVVSNTQTPANPRGNDIVGDFELGFVAQAPFSFSGGGLIIRISNPSAAYAMDATCSSVLVHADSSDPSGFFVGRRFNDPDGASPWSSGDPGDVAQFRVTLLPTSNSFSFGKLIRNSRKGTAMLPVTVPGPGTLALLGKGVKAQTAKATAGVRTSASGTVRLAVKPNGKLRKRLRGQNKARVGVNVTFTPAGDPAGDPSTQPKNLKLVQRPR